VSALAPTAGRLLGSWTLEALPVAALALSAGLYAIGAARARGGWPLRRTASFLAGLGTVALALLSGLDAYGERLLSVHVLQHMLLIMVAPPLLLFGAPVRLAFAALGRRARAALARALHSSALRLLTAPPCGLAVYTAVVLGTHLTGFYELALRNGALHELEHLAYLAAGLLFLAPIVAADPLPHRVRAIGTLALFTLAMTATAVTGAWLLSSQTVRYPFYLAPAHAMHSSALADQQLAGSIMIFGGGLVMAALELGLTMRALFDEELRQRRRERHLDASAQPAPLAVPLSVNVGGAG
jgi:cytochrome c oxidase assembly factor CtaG